MAMPSSQRFRPTRFDYDAFRSARPAAADANADGDSRAELSAVHGPALRAGRQGGRRRRAVPLGRDALPAAGLRPAAGDRPRAAGAVRREQGAQRLHRGRLARARELAERARRRGELPPRAQRPGRRSAHPARRAGGSRARGGRAGARHDGDARRLPGEEPLDVARSHGRELRGSRDPHLRRRRSRSAAGRSGRAQRAPRDRPRARHARPLADSRRT